jgi:release factor glutamine methyltransferase
MISREVYSPSDDSWLLKECILKTDLKGKKCLDLGTGSGVQGRAMLQKGANEIVFADINPRALLFAKKEIKAQNIGHVLVRFKKSDLFSNLKEKFDFIAFNPPYVPSDKIKWADLDGGENGRLVIDKFISRVPKHLNKKGVVLLLISSLNKPKEVIALLKKNDFSVEVSGRKKLFFEELLVLKCSFHSRLTKKAP